MLPDVWTANFSALPQTQTLPMTPIPSLSVAPLTEHTAFQAERTGPSQTGSGQDEISAAILHLAQAVGTGADIDLSDPAFDFMRSIDVFQVQLNQRESGRDGDCNRTANVRHGRYETNGQFRWYRSHPSAIPPAFVGDERYGSTCPSIWVRAVFVDWADYEGNYGFEQVNY